MKKELNYDEAFEITGQWRFCGLKEINDTEYAGTLAYDPNKRQLILSVDLQEEDSPVGEGGILAEENKNIPLIQGRTMEGNVYLFDCRMFNQCTSSNRIYFRGRTSYRCQVLLVGEKPLGEEERGIPDISWKDLPFTKARGEYKNLPYWSEGREIIKNYTKSKKDPSLNKPRYSDTKIKEISKTLTHKNWREEKPFEQEIFHRTDVRVRSFIDFDFKADRAEIRLEDLVKQISFLQDLLHFAMLPKVSTYPLTEWVVDTKGNTYQLFLPPPRLPIREKDHPSLPRNLQQIQNNCFIPYQYIEKIGECFETYKNDENVRLLLRFFLKSSYMMGDIADHEEMYVNTYTLLERASFTVNKEFPKRLKSKDLVMRFVKDLPEEIEEFIASRGKWKKQLEDPEFFIKKVIDYRNGIVHGDANTIEYDANDMLDKISIMYACVTYQIQKEIFQLPAEEIAANYERYFDYPLPPP